MKKDGDPWEMRMPAFGKKEIKLDNTLKPDSDSDTPETDWVVDHYSEDGIGDLIKKCRQLERRLAVVIESERVARMEMASNLCKLTSKESDRQYHINAINRLAKFLGFHGTSDDVIEAAVDNMKRFTRELATEFEYRKKVELERVEHSTGREKALRGLTACQEQLKAAQEVPMKYKRMEFNAQLQKELQSANEQLARYELAGKELPEEEYRCRDSWGVEVVGSKYADTLRTFAIAQVARANYCQAQLEREQAARQRAEKDAARFQERVNIWVTACMGADVAADKMERNFRYLEESLEVVQAGGCSKDDSQRLVEYVFSRPVGDIQQEVGGAMVTLAALCNAHQLGMNHAAIVEIARCEENTEKIRAKHFAKAIRSSPLPGYADAALAAEGEKHD